MTEFPFTVTEHIIDTQYIREYPHATTVPDAPLKLLVKKYTPVDNPNPQPGDVTLIGVPGTGYPKETYEPLWEDLLARSKQDGFRIRAIWMADAAHQAASGIYNEKYIGNDPSSFDGSRDLLHMINHFRDEMPRPLMGVGHSLGGTQLVLLSLIHPRLFTSLMLMEPYFNERKELRTGPRLAKMTANKQDIWPSRSAAADKARKVFPNWDPRVMDRWIKYGYRDLPTAIHPESWPDDTTNSPVTLSTTKHQELFTYTRPNFNRHRELGLSDEEEDTEETPSPPHDPLHVPDMVNGRTKEDMFYRPETIISWRLLPHVRPTVLYIGAETSGMQILGHHAGAVERLGTKWGGSGGKTYAKVAYVVLDQAGHGLPLEKPSATANELGPWIAKEMRRWREDERRMAERWEGLSGREKATFSDDWKKMLAMCPVDPKTKL